MPLSKVTITFERIANKNILGYKVFAIEPITAIQKCIAVIDNPKNINPVKVRKTLDLVPDNILDVFKNKYIIPHTQLIVDNLHPIKVYINHEELDPSLHAYNKEKNILLVSTHLRPKTKVEAEYYIDGIEYEITTESSLKYFIRPFIDSGNINVGKHNVLV